MSVVRLGFLASRVPLGLLGISLLAVLAAGCRGPADTDADADTDAVDDTDKVEDTDTDPVVVDTDIPFGVSDVPYTEGYAIIAMTHGPGGNVAHVTAQFWDTQTPPTSPSLLPTQFDTCVSATYTLAELTAGDAGERTVQSAGEITLSGPQTLSGLNPQASLGTAYYRELDPNAFAYGSVWDIAAAGAAFPAFSAVGDIVVPADLLVGQPPADFAIDDGPMTVSWLGGDRDAAVTIRVSTTDTVAQLYGRIVCEVFNDGSFEIPASDLAMMPAGFATVQVEHLHRVIAEVGGQPVRFEGVVSTLRVGTRL